MSRRRGWLYDSNTLRFMEHDITFHPETGKPWCRDLDLQDDTLEGLKQQMCDLQTKRENRPTVTVWTEGEKYNANGNWRKVNTKLTPIGRGEVTWVTWKDKHGRTQREQQYFSGLYPVNEQNDAIIAQLLELHKQLKELEQTIQDVESGLTLCETPKDD